MVLMIYKFKIKKKVTSKVIKEASLRSRNLINECESWGFSDPLSIQNAIKQEMIIWRKKDDGYTYVDDGKISLLISFYSYLVGRGYITKPIKIESNRLRGW